MKKDAVAASIIAHTGVLPANNLRNRRECKCKTNLAKHTVSFARLKIAKHRPYVGLASQKMKY